MISLGSHLSTRFGRNQSHLSQFSAAFRWLSSSSSANNEGGNDEAKSSGNVEWIPPNRPLHGDRDHSQLFRSQQELDRAEEALFTENEGDSEAETLRRLEEALALEERLEKDRLKDIDNRQQDPSNVDWLETRRKALGEKGDSESVVEVKHHKLLMENELSSLLESFGGRDITVLPDDEEYPRMGGATAMILCTASNQFYVHSIAKNLVDHLRERELQDVGVMGAKMGKGFLQANNRTNWNVLDCQNYIVHIFDDDTRQALNLEALWSGRDPIWRLDPTNEDAIEDYVAENHVPYEYGPNTDDIFGDASIHKLQRQQWLAPHRPVIPTHEKLRDRRAERRRRRERRQREATEFMN